MAILLEFYKNILQKEKVCAGITNIQRRPDEEDTNIQCVGISEPDWLLHLHRQHLLPQQQSEPASSPVAER